MRLLHEKQACIGCDIVDEIGLAQSTTSEHLRILKAAGIITGEIERPRVCYSLNPAALEPLKRLPRRGRWRAARRDRRTEWVRRMSTFERYLTVWVALCIVAGVALGHFLPGVFQAIGACRDRPGQSAGGGADLADDHPDAGEDRLRRARHRCRSIGAASASRCSSTGRSSRSRWRCSAGSSSAICSRPICPPTRSTATSPA